MKTIHSRSNKDIGDVIEGQWEITAKKIIAEPSPGDGNRPPRFGIYEYEVKATSVPAATAKSGRAKATKEPSVGGTRREASAGPMIVRRTA